MTATKKAAAKKSAPKSSKAAKPETAAKSQPETSKPEPQTSNAVARTRVTILGHSATSVLKWMGQNGIDLEGARKAVAKLASGEVKPSTITTGLSDGRSPKYGANAAKLTADEAKQVKAAAK